MFNSLNAGMQLKIKASLDTCTLTCSLVTTNVRYRFKAKTCYLFATDPHAACFPLQPSYIASNGERVAPIAAMVANFTKP